MAAVSLYDTVLWAHIIGVLVAFAGPFSYLIWFAWVDRSPMAERAFFHRVQTHIGKRLVAPGLLVILLAGAYLATDRDLWSEVWVTVPLVLLVILGGLGGAYFTPREERLAELAANGDTAAYEPLYAQVKRMTYVGVALVLVAAFFMVTKLGS